MARLHFTTEAAEKVPILAPAYCYKHDNLQYAQTAPLALQRKHVQKCFGNSQVNLNSQMDNERQRPQEKHESDSLRSLVLGVSRGQCH